MEQWYEFVDVKLFASVNIIARGREALPMRGEKSAPQMHVCRDHTSPMLRNYAVYMSSHLGTDILTQEDWPHLRGLE